MLLSIDQVRAALGANRAVGTSEVLLFVPSVTRDRTPINQKEWVDQALSVMGQLFRGATAFPPGRGVWRDGERGGELVFDDTVMITSYADPEVIASETTLPELRRFLHRMGQEAGQGEVGLLVDGTYFDITKYDEGKGEPS
jgi:hypothetical protein